jgi:hypothetical protein
MKEKYRDHIVFMTSSDTDSFTLPEPTQAVDIIAEC